MIDRVPPHNADAEAAVLSALIINNKGFESVEDLTPGDFYKGANKKIFQAMLDLRKDKHPVDLVTVGSELGKAGYLESVGPHLASIANDAPVALNVGNYATSIKNLATARRVINTALSIVDQGYEVRDIEGYVSKSQSEMLQIQTTSTQDRFTTMDELMTDALARIESAQTKNEDIGLNLGMPTLDNFTMISGSKLILLAGRPGMGKTALALSIAKYLAERQTKVGFLSIEMDKESFADRLLSIESNINTLCFYARQSLNRSSMAELEMAASQLHSLPIYIDDSECTIQDVERKCRKMKKMGCKIIFIDQLSKIRGDRKQSKFDQYTDNCSSIALLKKELRLPIVLLCQLNRTVESTDDKRPSMSHLKQTGMLEEDADMVFLLFRPGYYDTKIDASRTEIILAKNRQGALGIEHSVLFKQKRGMFQMGAA